MRTRTSPVVGAPLRRSRRRLRSVSDQFGGDGQGHHDRGDERKDCCDGARAGPNDMGRSSLVDMTVRFVRCRPYRVHDTTTERTVGSGGQQDRSPMRGRRPSAVTIQLPAAHHRPHRERARIQLHPIDAEPRRQAAAVGQAQQLGGVGSGGADGLDQRDARAHDVAQLETRAATEPARLPPSTSVTVSPSTRTSSSPSVPRLLPLPARAMASDTRRTRWAGLRCQMSGHRSGVDVQCGGWSPP